MILSGTEAYSMELLPRAEAEGRLRRLQRWMQAGALDAVAILHNPDLFYFAGTIQAGVLWLPAAGEPIYFITKSLRRGREESPWERLVELRSLGRLPDVLAGEGLGRPRRLGLELDVLPASYYLRFQSLFAGAELVDASDAVRRTRMLKSASEVSEIRRAAGMLARAYERMPEWILPESTELELHARIEGFLRHEGHQGITRMRGLHNEIAYGTASSGPSACYPTCFPGPVGFVGLYPAVPNGGSRRRLAPGEPVIVDIVGGYGGYIADQTRVFVPGEPARDLVDAHEFALSLARDIEGMLRPGRTCSEIYRAVRERVEASPYAPNFMGLLDSQVRFVGHGVGLELDELPVLASGFDYPLEAGMTIAVEPKIFLPDRGGVGIEDTYLVTESGCERLTAFPEEIVAVRI